MEKLPVDVSTPDPAPEAINELAITLPAFNVILPLAVILKSEDETICPTPVRPEINVFAITFPAFKLMLPAALILKSEDETICPTPVRVETKVFAIIFPAFKLMLPNAFNVKSVDDEINPEPVPEPATKALAITLPAALMLLVTVKLENVTFAVVALDSDDNTLALEKYNVLPLSDIDDVVSVPICDALILRDAIICLFYTVNVED